MIRVVLLALFAIGFVSAKPALACEHEAGHPAVVAVVQSVTCDVPTPSPEHRHDTADLACCVSPSCAPLSSALGTVAPMVALRGPAHVMFDTHGLTVRRAPPVPPPRA